MSDDFGVVILAAGMGTRMKSSTPKVLHKIFDKTLLEYTIEASIEAGAKKIVIVTGHKEEMVQKVVKNANFVGQGTKAEIVFAHQDKQEGTGHAVKMAVPYLTGIKQTVVLYGDCPLITPQTLKSVVDNQRETNSKFSLVSVMMDDPTGYGRIIRDDAGHLIKITEQKDATEQEKQIKESNAGLYCFDTEVLKITLDQIKNNNANKEYYLTDTLELTLGLSHKASAVVSDSPDDLYGINSRVQLAFATKIMQKRINEKLMIAGVTMIDPDTAYISSDVRIGQDTVIHPNVTISNGTQIGEGCEIGSGTNITACKIGDDTTIDHSVLTQATIGDRTSVGPFAYLRPGCVVGDDCRIGDFVEVKNSTIGNGSKASHLSYIGDAEIGKNVNLGCGIVTVNYDGKNKFKTIVGDDAFIGCNSNLVAPVTVEKGSYVAAGTTVTNNVPAGSLAIGRSRQVIKENWSRK